MSGPNVHVGLVEIKLNVLVVAELGWPDVHMKAANANAGVKYWSASA